MSIGTQDKVLKIAHGTVTVLAAAPHGKAPNPDLVTRHPQAGGRGPAWARPPWSLKPGHDRALTTVACG